MISLNKVFVKYTKEFYALSNISLNILPDEVVALVGPKDSGKTSLLRLLAGWEKHEKGEIYVKDISIEKLDYATDVSLGYLPLNTIFFDKKTVYDNLKYVLDIRKEDKAVVEEKINKAVIDFRLESILHQKVYKLTNFEKYLVSIARLSFRKLNIVLIDNIFEDLEKNELKEILKLIKKYFVTKNSIVLVATSSEEIAKKLATRLVYLNYGAITKEQNNSVKGE